MDRGDKMRCEHRSLSPNNICLARVDRLAKIRASLFHRFNISIMGGRK
jgi:hypothetical protein